MEHHQKTMEQRYYTLDEFLLKLLPPQHYTNVIYFDFRRDNQAVPFIFKSLKMLYAAIVFLLADCLCNLRKISLEIGAQRLSEAKQIGAVCSIEFLCLIRGISLVCKHNSMLELTNELDRVFPRNLQLQKRMNCDKFAKYLIIRYRVLYLYSLVGLAAFIGIPLAKYLLFYDSNSGLPLRDEYHQHASWFPYHLKENPKAYPYIYIIETVITIFGINCMITWDHIYTVSVAQCIMHFEFVNTELGRLDANDSLKPLNIKEFYKKFKEIIMYHQHVCR